MPKAPNASPVTAEDRIEPIAGQPPRLPDRQSLDRASQEAGYADWFKVPATFLTRETVLIITRAWQLSLASAEERAASDRQMLANVQDKYLEAQSRLTATPSDRARVDGEQPKSAMSRLDAWAAGRAMNNVWATEAGMVADVRALLSHIKQKEGVE